MKVRVNPKFLPPERTQKKRDEARRSWLRRMEEAWERDRRMRRKKRAPW